MKSIIGASSRMDRPCMIIAFSTKLFGRRKRAFLSSFASGRLYSFHSRAESKKEPNKTRQMSLMGEFLTKSNKDGTEHGCLGRVSGSLYGQIRDENEPYSTGDCKLAHTDIWDILRVQAAYSSRPYRRTNKRTNKRTRTNKHPRAPEHVARELVQ